jgi:Holliday junction resolvasome RuvABC DNA-binding subunit
LPGLTAIPRPSGVCSAPRVNGIGARTALAILSGSEVDEFAACVRSEDIARLTRLPGTGTKTAQRLVVDIARLAYGMALEVSRT